MSYAIARLEKVKAPSVVPLQLHNDRKTKNHSNEDINSELSYLNYHLIECESYKDKINEELENRYKGKRSLRKDANVAVEVVFTSDKKFFDSLSSEQEKLFFEKSLEFLKEFAGEKNIISAVIHKDEETPHMHALFTPLTNDGRLSYCDFINTKYDLIKFQDNFFDKMSKEFPQLERGKSANETKRKHLSVEDFKKQTEYEKLLTIEDITKNIDEKKPSIINKEHKVTLKKDDYDFLLEHAVYGEEFKKEKNRLRKELKKLKKEKEILENSSKEYKDLLDDLKRSINAKELELKFLKSDIAKLKEEKTNSKDLIDRFKELLPKDKVEELQNENHSFGSIKVLEDNNLAEHLLKIYIDIKKENLSTVNKVDLEFIQKHCETNKLLKEFTFELSDKKIIDLMKFSPALFQEKRQKELEKVESKSNTWSKGINKSWNSKVKNDKGNEWER